MSSACGDLVYTNLTKTITHSLAQAPTFYREITTKASGVQKICKSSYLSAAPIDAPIERNWMQPENDGGISTSHGISFNMLTVSWVTWFKDQTRSSGSTDILWQQWWIGSSASWGSSLLLFTFLTESQSHLTAIRNEEQEVWATDWGHWYWNAYKTVKCVFSNV